MDLPTPQGAVVALAAFVRQRLADVGDTIAPLLTRREGGAVDRIQAGEQAHRTARQFAAVIVAAAAPFASTSYARARLLRQMHASGLLSEQEAEQTIDSLGIAQ